MNRKKLTKIYTMISIRKNPLVLVLVLVFVTVLRTLKIFLLLQCGDGLLTSESDVYSVSKILL